jgi:hypothetical protein
MGSGQAREKMLLLENSTSSFGAIDAQDRVLDDAETERSRHERVTGPPTTRTEGGR